MTIAMYTGTTGSGKSAHAASVIRFELMVGRPVVANFEINKGLVKHPELFHYVPNEELSAERIEQIARDYWSAPDAPTFREDGLTLILDEAQLLFNSRCWQQKGRNRYLQFLSQSRKAGYFVILVTQNSRMIDNQFRMLVDYEVNHRKLGQMGLIGELLDLLTFHRLMCRVKSNYQCNEHIGTSFAIARRKDWELYDSYKTFEGSFGANGA